MSYDDFKLVQRRKQAGQPAPAAAGAVAPGKQTRTMRLPPRQAGRPALVQHKRDLAADAARAEQAWLTQRWTNTTIRPDLYPPPEPAPVQRKRGSSAAPDAGDVHGIAAQGLSGAATTLPHVEQIQHSFGRYDVGGIAAHIGGPASRASQAMGARAYATGDHVAFGDTPDLHTAAHEAAHVVQQRAGVSLHGGVGRDGDAYERHADAVADRVVRGESAEGLLATMAPGGESEAGVQTAVQRLAGDGEEGVGGDDIRVAILNVALATTPLMAMVAAVNAAGMAISAACIGLRGNFMAHAGAGGGGGVDGMFFLDPANWQISGDVVPFAEIGVGVEEGAGFGVVLGLRISPHGEYGQANESYAGPAINASVEALAGLGFSVSPSLFSGQEGWATMLVSLGEQFGASLSVSYAVSGQQVAQQLSRLTNSMTSALSSAVQTLAQASEAVSSAVQSVFQQVFGIFFPDRWNLAGYTDDEAASLRRFGHYMNEVIAGQGGIDAFLRTESQDPPPSISSRVQQHSHWDLVTMIAVSQALNNKYHRRFGSEEEAGNIWEPEYFNSTSYLNFLRFCMDNDLFSA